MHVPHSLRTGTPQLLRRDRMVGADYIGSLPEEASHDDKPKRVVSWAHSAGVA